MADLLSSLGPCLFSLACSGECAVRRFALVFCISALLGCITFSCPALAVEAQPDSALEDGLPGEVLPDEQDAPDRGSGFPPATAGHAPLPSLTVLRGICSVNLQASGLLDYLAPFLVRETGIVIRWRAVDDKRAELLIREGNGDLALLAMQDDEKALIREGRAELSQKVMRDGYLLVGPEDDPAGIRDQDILEALRRIADAGALFVSRGDGSATHKRERALWNKAAIAVRDERNGYVESGQRALASLSIAEALGAYTLTDEASFLAYQAAHPTTLTVLAENQPSLSRVWSLLLLTPPADAPDAAARALRALTAHSLLEWWQKPSTRELVSRFTREGHILFLPTAPDVLSGSAPSSSR